MKKYRKSIIVCSVLALGFAATGVATFDTATDDNVSASAATATVASFEVSDGASVRIEEGSNGIRFETKISDKYYEDLQTEFSNGTFKFYTVIDRAENADDEEAEIYEHTVNANSFVDGYATYYSAITYDNLTESELDLASGMELSAKAYVEIAVAGQDTITREAKAEDAIRSMRSVANLSLLTDEYKDDPEAIAKLKTYLGTIGRKETLDYVETSAETKTLTLTNAAEGMDVYLNGKNTGLTTGANGVVDYSSWDLSDYTLGDYLYVSAFNDDNDVVSAKARYVTQAIETESELRAFSTMISKASYDGQYYVLANNIECADSTAFGTAHWYNFTSTLDGQGYYVNNMYVNQYGFLSGRFGVKGQPASIKNIAFTNVNSTVDTPRLITFDKHSGGTLSNVYVSAVCENLTLFDTNAEYQSVVLFDGAILENCAGVFSGENNNAVGFGLSTNSLYMISGTETPVSLGEPKYATNSTQENKYGYCRDADANGNPYPEYGYYGGAYWFADYETMANAKIQKTAEMDTPTLKPFNDCWNLTEGYPVWKNLPAEVIAITAKQYVEQPTAEYGTDTAAGYSALALSGVQDETVSVSINGGEATTMNVSNGSVQVAWTAFANAGVALGQTVPMVVKASDGTTWIFNEVMYVTQAIDTEKEFREVCDVIRTNTYTGMYFVLANNIDCTDTTLLGGTQKWGRLSSTFDGQGYYVNNLYVGAWGIFGGNINGGTLKNIAFTNVNSTDNNPVLFGTGGSANIQGQISNVYVSSAHNGLTLYQTAHTSFKSWGYFNAVVLENCAGVYAENSGKTGTISTNSLYMISAEETSVAADRYATNTTKTDVNKYEYLESDTKYGGIYWFASYELMAAANISSTATASAPTTAYFNDCWDLTNGYPVWKNLPKA